VCLCLCLRFCLCLCSCLRGAAMHASDLLLHTAMVAHLTRHGPPIDRAEDERHFLLQCSFLEEERERLWHSIHAACSQSHHHALCAGQLLVVDAFGWSEDERFTLLLGGMHLNVAVARMERKVRTLILATLSGRLQKRRRELEWLETCLMDS